MLERSLLAACRGPGSRGCTLVFFYNCVFPDKLLKLNQKEKKGKEKDESYSKVEDPVDRTRLEQGVGTVKKNYFSGLGER